MTSKRFSNTMDSSLMMNDESQDEAFSNGVGPESQRVKCWVPYSPGGSVMAELEGESEATAWRNLMRWAEGRGLHYTTRGALEQRGYTVRRK